MRRPRAHRDLVFMTGATRSDVSAHPPPAMNHPHHPMRATWYKASLTLLSSSPSVCTTAKASGLWNRWYAPADSRGAPVGYPCRQLSNRRFEHVGSTGDVLSLNASDSAKYGTSSMRFMLWVDHIYDALGDTFDDKDDDSFGKSVV